MIFLDEMKKANTMRENAVIEQMKNDKNLSFPRDEFEIEINTLVKNCIANKCKDYVKQVKDEIATFVNNDMTGNGTKIKWDNNKKTIFYHFDMDTILDIEEDLYDYVEWAYKTDEKGCLKIKCPYFDAGRNSRYASLKEIMDNKKLPGIIMHDAYYSATSKIIFTLFTRESKKFYYGEWYCLLLDSLKDLMLTEGIKINYGTPFYWWEDHDYEYNTSTYHKQEISMSRLRKNQEFDEISERYRAIIPVHCVLCLK